MRRHEEIPRKITLQCILFSWNSCLVPARGFGKLQGRVKVQKKDLMSWKKIPRLLSGMHILVLPFFHFFRWDSESESSNLDSNWKNVHSRLTRKFMYSYWSRCYDGYISLSRYLNSNSNSISYISLGNKPVSSFTWLVSVWCKYVCWAQTLHPASQQLKSLDVHTRALIALNAYSTKQQTHA